MIRKYTLTLLGMAMAMWQFASAQLSLEYGKSFPMQPEQYAWFSDTVNHQLWQWVDRWELRDSETDKVGTCRSFMISESVEGKTIFERNGTVAFPTAFSYQCADSIFVVHSGKFNAIERSKKVSFFDQSGKLVRFYDNHTHYIHEIQWKGGLAWSLPGYDPVDGKIDIPLGEQIHNWGVFAGNGRWVIQPIYDLPVKFVNGIAEVRYYGKPLKINENGETVE
jgi:hypothetical protein